MITEFLIFKIKSFITLSSARQHDGNGKSNSPYFTDNLNTPDNMSRNTHTKLFKLRFSGASGNNRMLILSGLKSLDFRPLIYFDI